jgi:signal transduction histidine kinase
MTAARAVESHLRHLVHEHHDRLRARYQARAAGGSERRALVTATGQILADDPRGWLRDGRLELPPGGGELTLPTGERAVAEPVGDDAAFIVRDLERRARRDELRKVTEEQAALRRLARAVARGLAPPDIFRAVAEEVGPLLGAEETAVVRFEPDGTANVLARVRGRMEEIEPGGARKLEDSIAIAEALRTGRSARADAREYGATSGAIGAHRRRVDGQSVVASPIVVDGRLWGAMTAATTDEVLAADMEGQMADFANLVGLVIANAESRAELMASRARVTAAADEARRRIQRDLHDGAQQCLVNTMITLKMARQALGETAGPAVDLVDEALAHAESANSELRELAHGILPRALTQGGLRGGVEALVSRARMPVSVEVTVERLPAVLEAGAYFIIGEALTNAIKHARASSARIAAFVEGEVLRLEVRDDGVGGAVTNGSSGLLGLYDRAAALNGRLGIESPSGEGTTVTAWLPIPGLLSRNHAAA